MLTLFLHKNGSGHVRTASPWYGAFCSNILHHLAPIGDLLERKRLDSMYHVKCRKSKMVGTKEQRLRQFRRQAVLFLLTEL
jgi:hypothetical protein